MTSLFASINGQGVQWYRSRLRHIFLSISSQYSGINEQRSMLLQHRITIPELGRFRCILMALGLLDLFCRNIDTRQMVAHPYKSITARPKDAPEHTWAHVVMPLLLSPRRVLHVLCGASGGGRSGGGGRSDGNGSLSRPAQWLAARPQPPTTVYFWLTRLADGFSRF